MTDSTPGPADAPQPPAPAAEVKPPEPADSADSEAMPLAPIASAPMPLVLPDPLQFTEVRSADGRMVLTNDQLQINGQVFGWWELEGVDVQRVRWLLWLLLGGFTLAGFLLGFLQNWLRTMPAVLGIMVGTLLLAMGQRGTNRVRLHRLGREAMHFALPGELASWQKLTAEANRRIRQRHHEAAQAATAVLLASTPAFPDSPLSTEAT
ncbi:hypothetical protein [Hymenobacter sp. YC55]|uniref:hypothetical protein n=1 Tax=Hymenobacter sp. YC55 TaxID=3034019 RepID=UPI0023FA0E41|nr:hypothetical protein [Hymenobacter sp. YC55]MDF7811383.1 hypothetical protein [Hymenobacter sp. YC55]